MNQKTIERFKNLSSTERSFSIKYEENFFKSGNSKVVIELNVPNTILYWTDKVPSNIFEEVRNEAIKALFEAVKEDMRALTDKYFTVTFEKNYESDGDEITNCAVYVENMEHFRAQNFEDVIKQLKEAIEQKKRKEEKM